MNHSKVLCPLMVSCVASCLALVACTSTPAPPARPNGGAAGTSSGGTGGGGPAGDGAGSGGAGSGGAGSGGAGAGAGGSIVEHPDASGGAAGADDGGPPKDDAKGDATTIV